MKPFHISKRWQIFLATIAVISWVNIHQHFTQMDDLFFQPSLQGMKGLLLYEVGNYNGAVDAYRAHFIKRDDWEETDDPALNALLRGDYLSAEMISKSDLGISRNEINAYLTLGEVALEKEMYDEAQKWFNHVLESERDQFDALLLSSLVQARVGRDVEAVEFINRALRHHRIETRITSFFLVLEMMGDLLEAPSKEEQNTLLAHYFRYLRIFDNSNGRKAITFAKRGIKNNDYSEAAYLTMGIIFDKDGRIEKALSAYSNAIEMNPEYAEAYRRLAQIYSDRGDLENEYKMTKTAYEVAPKDYYMQVYRGFLSNKLGDYYQALIFTEQLLKKDPENIDLIKAAAFYLRFIGKEEEAIQYYQKGLVLYPKDASLYEGLGYSFVELEKFNKASKAFQTALAINDTQPGAYAGMSFVHNKTNQKIKAIKALETAFSYGYRSKTQRMNLCTLYHTVSEFEKAASCLRWVLADEPRNAYAGNLLTYTLKNIEDQ
jgi:tetratricopeptide (TPR) repeat protein